MNETEMIKVFIQHQAFQLFKWLFGNLTIDFDPYWLPFALSEELDRHRPVFVLLQEEGGGRS